MKTKKKFDCVEMMHEGAERVRRQVEGMSVAEEVEFWRQKTEELRRMKRRAMARKAS